MLRSPNRRGGIPGRWRRTLVPLALALSFTTNARGERPERVLAIGGAVTEIVFELGEQHRLVGRDTTSTYPPEAWALPDVGYIRALSPEGVLSVAPDLVLARENNGPAEAVEVLKESGLHWVDVPDDFSVQGIDDNVRIVAAALGVPEKGDALRARIASDLVRVAERVERIAPRKRVLFVLSVRDDRVVAAGQETAAEGIIALAGAENAMSSFVGYKPVSPEALIETAPEAIVMMARRGEAAGHSVSNPKLEAHTALATTPAVQRGAVIRMDGLKMLGFGPRTAEAALELAALIYPEEFRADAESARDAEGKVRPRSEPALSESALSEPARPDGEPSLAGPGG